MKLLITLFFIVLISIILGVFIHTDSGYVLIAYQKWTIETNLLVFLFALLILFTLLYWIFSLSRSTNDLAKKFNAWRVKRKLNKAAQETNNALFELISGNWQNAEKKLIKYAQNDDSYLINCFGAAYAAQKQKNYANRDLYLKIAAKSAPRSELIIGLAQAQLQLQARQLEIALATLRRLRELAPKHKFVLLLLQKTYIKLHDWSNLLEILPLLQKYKILDKNQLKQLQKNTYQHLLQAQVDAKDLVRSNQLWAELNRDLQKDSDLLEIYAQILLQHHDQNQIEKIFCSTLQTCWSQKLIKIYGQLDSSKPTQQLSTAENWLKNHPNDVELLIALGHICKRQKLWGKAQNYFKTSITVQPNKAAYIGLAQIMEALSNPEMALEYYREAVNIA